MSKLSLPFLVQALLANVASLTATPVGTTGAATWEYSIVGVTEAGKKSLAVAGTTGTGNAVLGAVNLNRITWTDVAGYVSYEIYRTASGGTPTEIGLIGKVLAGVQTIDDIGQHVQNTIVASAANTTGHTDMPLLSFNGPVTVSVEAVGTGTYQLQGSYGGAWTNEGAAFTANAIRVVTLQYAKLRVSCSAFTSGTPVAYASGDDK